MKIPESIRIGGVEYPVTYKADLNDGTNMLYGQIDYDNCKIELSDTIATAHERRCITLWHMKFCMGSEIMPGFALKMRKRLLICLPVASIRCCRIMAGDYLI